MTRRRAWLAIAALALAACGGGGEGGDAVPAVEVTELRTGDSFLLSEIISETEGPAVVNLWATWCAPCRAEIPDFEEVHRARGDEVTFVGVNIGEDPERAAKFIDEVGATYLQYSDGSGDVQVELRATSMPTTVIVAADGTIIEKHLGPLDQDGLNAAIDTAIAAD